MNRLYIVVQILLGLALALSLAACEDVADRDRLEALTQDRLTLALGPDTFEIASLRRQGRGPLDPDAQGRDRRIVYFNAAFQLKRDLDFSSWSNLNVAAFANLMGATERGVEGIRQGGNRAGAPVLVRGSLTFVREATGWTAVDAAHPEVGTPSAYSPGSSAESRRIIERIPELLERKSSDPKRQRLIVTEELDEAFQAIQLRLERLERGLSIASGPAGGEYQAVARLLGQTLAAEGVAVRAVETQGSAENLRLLRSGQADLALVQSDMAEQAHLGVGPFAGDGPFYGLRALASLFPEPLHVIVPTGSPIQGVSDLAGKRVAIGTPESGTRAGALALLQAAGLTPKDLGEAREAGLEAGLGALARGELDAVIATISAPAHRLRDAAANGAVRFLSLAPEQRQRLVSSGAGLVYMVLPVATYPNQREPVRTVAVTALLVASETMVAADVDKTLDALFRRIDFVRAGVAAGSQIETSSADRGIAIPVHPAALPFLGGGLRESAAPSAHSAATAGG